MGAYAGPNATKIVTECGMCAFGLIDPPSTKGGTLWFVRAFQYRQGALTFCDCAAGQGYRKYLDAVVARMASAYRMGADTAIRKGIEYIPQVWVDAAKRELDDWYEQEEASAYQPTVHWEGAE